MTISESSVTLSTKSVSTCMIGIAALLAGVSPAWAQVSLGAASQFSVLGGTNVTCTGGSVVIGDIGVSSGSFTDTGCTIAGGSPPTTNAAAALAQSQGVIPPTVNWEYPDPACPMSLSNRARPLRHAVTLINAHGLAGVNSSLILEQC